MSKIKVLIIDQMGVFRSERKKYIELAKFPELDVAVLVPTEWKFNFHRQVLEDEPPGNFKLMPLRVVFPGYGHRSFFSFSIVKSLREFKPDIIHLFQEPYSFFAAQIVFLRNLLLPDTKIIFITWQNLYFKNYPFQFSKIYNLIEKYAYKNAAGATPITKSAKEVLLKKGFGKVAHVLNWGIDFDLFEKHALPGLKKDLNLENKFVVGFVGRFVEEKGVLDLLRAFAQLEKETALLLLGDGPLKEEVLSRARDGGLTHRVIIVSSVSNSRVSSYLNCMDVLVLPSRPTGFWVEQLGKVLLEAMACRVPVIGSDSGEIPNVIGKAGLLFRPGDVKDLKEKIESIKNGTVDCRKLVDRGYQKVSTEYSWHRIASKLQKVYKDL